MMNNKSVIFHRRCSKSSPPFLCPVETSGIFVFGEEERLLELGAEGSRTIRQTESECER